MKNKLYNRHSWQITLSCMIICCCISTTIKAYQINLSFDSLFPMTWYQKGLESSLHVWQSLVTVFEQSSDGTTLSFDILLGRLAFAQFCINRMHQENKPSFADNNTYFKNVLYKIHQLLGLVIITPKTEDFVLCAEDILEDMQRKLQN